MTKLADVAQMTFGFAFKSAEFSDAPDDIRLLRGDNIGQGRLRWDGAKRFPLARVDEVKKYELDRGDVVIAMDRPWIGAGLKYSVVRDSDIPSLLVQRVARVRAKDDRLDQGFLAAIIGSRAFTDYVIGVQTGSAVPHISGEQIGAFEFDLPGIGEQRAIAALLGALDDKIESDRRAVGLLDELLLAEFQRVVAGTRASEALLSDHVIVSKGVSYKSIDLQPSRTSLVTLKSIDRAGGYKPEGLKPYVGPYKSQQVLHPGDIVVAQTDLTQGAEVVGRAVRVPSDSSAETLVASLDLAIIRPRGDMPIEYLQGILTDEAFRQYCRSRTSGTTVLHLSSDVIPAYRAPIATARAQREYSEFARPLIERIDSYSDEIRKLLATRNGLVPSLLSGRIRVAQPTEVLV